MYAFKRNKYISQRVRKRCFKIEKKMMRKVLRSLEENVARRDRKRDQFQKNIKNYKRRIFNSWKQ